MLKSAIVLITHQTPAEVAAMSETWQRLNEGAVIHVAYGGAAENFRKLPCPESRRSFIDDPRLKTRDHQRDRQSYRGVMRQVASDLAGNHIDRVLMVECDVMPLRPGFIDYLEKRREEEDADLLGVRLRRVDGTCHPHFLAHLFHPEFQNWISNSIRPEKNVVLMMIGCLSWWTWRAFKATSEADEPLPVYLELAMPTAAHQLGFRVREMPELNECLRPLGEVEGKIDQWRASGQWVAHPCKNIWKRDGR